MTRPPLDAPSNEKTLSSETIYQGRVLHFKIDQIELPNGVVQRREFVEHPGGVTVVPVLENGNMLMVYQYRYPLQRYLYEFPAGKLEPGESFLASVQRELEEETGYCAKTWETLPSIYMAAGFCNEVIHIFKATNLYKCESPRREEDEFIEAFEVSKDDIRQMLKNNQLVDGKTICALGFVCPEVFQD